MIDKKDNQKIKRLTEQFHSIFEGYRVQSDLKADDIHAMALILLNSADTFPPGSPEQYAAKTYAELLINILIAAFPESLPLYKEFKKHIDA